jgi:RNA polymerase sigma-70 factor (ECF subfamily)
MSGAKRRKAVGPDHTAESRIDSREDETLFERLRIGHREALGLLMERHWASLVGYAAGITDDRDAAQDVVQGTFVQIWARRAEWESSGSPRAYLFRITRNLALNARRDGILRHRRQKEWGSDSPFDFPSPPTPDEETEVELLRAEIEGAIASLPERRREVFMLSRFPGLTYQEIAETMGISVQTVSNQMSAALAQLRSLLGHHLDR